eukprot:53489_1
MSNEQTNDSVAPVKRVIILKPFKRGKQPKGERYSRKDYLKAINDVFQDVPMVIRCIHPVFFIQFKSNEIAADAVKTIRSLVGGRYSGWKILRARQIWKAERMPVKEGTHA